MSDEDEDKDEDEGGVFVDEDADENGDVDLDVRAFKPSLNGLAATSDEEAEDVLPDEDAEIDEDEDEDEGEASDVEFPSDLSDSDEDPAALDDLDAFVDQLAAKDKKRKTVGTAPEGKERKRRRVLPVVSGPALRDDDLSLKSGTSEPSHRGVSL
jgi:U3 small nucleolar RNA-associated protein 14